MLFNFLQSRFFVRSALFFLMLLSLGLGSQIGIIEGLTSTLFDHPRLHKVSDLQLEGSDYLKTNQTKAQICSN